MSAALRTTTLTFGPFPLPLSVEHASLLAYAFARALGHGYALNKVTTATTVTLHAVQSVPRTQPFTRIREILPSVVVDALVGSATAQETR